MIVDHWQDITAGLIALAALAYYVRRRRRARGAACEGCPSGGCAIEPGKATPGDAHSKRGELVSIEGIERPAPSPR